MCYSPCCISQTQSSSSYAAPMLHLQVVKSATEGVLIFSDSLTAPSWTTDLWAQYDFHVCRLLRYSLFIASTVNTAQIRAVITILCRWFAWEATRWIKSCSFIRPLQQERFLFHERRSLGKVIQGSTTNLKVPAARLSALAKVHGAAYVAGELPQAYAPPACFELYCKK